MNLPEYYSMVLDECEAKYKSDAEVDNPVLQNYYLNDCGGYNDKDSYYSYIVREALQRLKEIEGFREILKIHNTLAALYNNSQASLQDCQGCGLDAWEESATPNVNDCPTLLALVKSQCSDRADFGSWV